MEGGRRPERSAARKARDQLENSTKITISDSDDSSDGMNGDSDEQHGDSDEQQRYERERSSNAEPVAEPVAEPLSEYELQRKRNMQSNQQVLESLGIAGASTVHSHRRKQPTKKQVSPASTEVLHGSAQHKKARLKRQVVSAADAAQSTSLHGSAQSRHSRHGDLAVASEGERVLARKEKRREEEKEAKLQEREEQGKAEDRFDAANLFRALLNGGDLQDGTAPDESAITGLLCPHHIRRTAAALQIDLQGLDANEMVELFDEGAKGALTFDEFCRIKQQISS